MNPLRICAYTNQTDFRMFVSTATTVRKVLSEPEGPRNQLATLRGVDPWWKQARAQCYAYDAQGLPTRVIDAQGRVAFARTGTNTSNQSLRSRQLTDDFGRNVATISPDSGTTTRGFDAADHLVDSTDAKGNQAHYAYDVRGRIQQQTIQDISGTPPQTTTWDYQGARLIALHHPTQSERYAYDARGLRTEKITTLNTPQGSFTSITRYQFDDSGVLQSSSLPDGSQMAYERNGQGQLVALKRERILTSWLRWAAPAQTLVKDLQRDLVGLKRYTTGNGIEAEFQRSKDGSLARVAYRQTRAQPTQTAANSLHTLLGRSTQEFIDLLLGIRSAHAALTDVPAPSPQAATPAPADSSKPNTTDALPGALGLPQDPRAFMDHRYLWDVRGNLLYTQSTLNQSPTQDTYAYAYDGKDRLVAAVSPQAVSRYFYDAANRRVLSQQGIASQDDTRSNTYKTSYQPSTHRWASNDGEGSTGSLGSKSASYDANGQPQTIGQREYIWDALGKLIAVREQDKTLASYRYNHRGERVGKTVGDQKQGFLYDNQQLIGELNAQGQLTRQYIYLADQPMAVVDTPEGQLLRKPDASAFADIVHDLQTIVSVWFTHDTIVWLHTNHLGATEAATDGKGKLVWQARYAPFGQATVSSISSSQSFTLNLRLPGQYADAETGLFYNRQRYYDPERGQYLTPDPLGTPNGPNGYAYVRYNPLKYVDPEGLVLFAFDGTGNSDNLNDPAMLLGSLSNVVEFSNRYDTSSEVRYVTGVGTVHKDTPENGVTSSPTPTPKENYWTTSLAVTRCTSTTWAVTTPGLRALTG
jgi:RHS repeat-associated protein